MNGPRADAGGSAVVHRLAVAAIPELPPKTWREQLSQRLRSDRRMATMYGRRTGDQVQITAVLLGPSNVCDVLRTTVAAGVGYHELTSVVPALHCFERELHEQTGVRIADHPWLKPIRYAGQEQSAMNGYPFYRVEGKEVHEVAVGPIHAGVIEPGSFRFQCLGEQVHHLEIHLGYQHRGVEARLLVGDPRRLMPLVETIAGDSSIAHAFAGCAALEALAAVALPFDVDLARVVALELERIAMHLASLAGLAADIGFLPGATTYGRLRTTAINTTMRLCGSRFGRGALRPGGVRMAGSAELLATVQANVQLLQHDLALVDELFLSARTVRHRLRGVGTLSTAVASELGLVGMAARASGVDVDLRAGHAHGAYGGLPLPRQLLTAGDCHARAQLRILELQASLAWLAKALDRRPDWQSPPVSLPAFAADTLVIAMVEGWRGEVVHCLETDAAGALCHYKVQDPSLRNWFGLAMAVRGNEISDFPICNKSFDLSYCGNDL